MKPTIIQTAIAGLAAQQASLEAFHQEYPDAPIWNFHPATEWQPLPMLVFDGTAPNNKRYALVTFGREGWMTAGASEGRQSIAKERNGVKIQIWHAITHVSTSEPQPVDPALLGAVTEGEVAK